MTKGSCHSFAELGEVVTRMNTVEDQRKILVDELAEACGALSRIVGPSGMFQVVLHIQDADRFSNVGPLLERLPSNLRESFTLAR
ncbi:MAG TPA: hypothetical protein VFF06_07765 [Polyangia bacterium]|nr:hypothetical protein [Polyangia bacterium]